MSETISGNLHTLQTLNPADPIVTITGTITAGSSLTGTNLTTQPGYGAVYGAAPTDFTVTNLGLVIDTFATPVAGANAGIVLGAFGTVDNKGTLLASTGGGIYLDHGGAAINSGSIIGYESGITVDPATLNGGQEIIVNTGLIDAASKVFTLAGSSNNYFSTAAFLLGAGTIDNEAGGTITAQYGDGIFLYGQQSNYLTDTQTLVAATGFNAGTVSGVYGVEFASTGVFTNTGRIAGSIAGMEISVQGTLANQGNITGGSSGVASNGALAIFNSGTVQSTGTIPLVLANSQGNAVTLQPDGIALLASGIITNTSSGLIDGDNGYGVYLGAGGSIRNAGQILGNNGGLVAKGEAFVSNSGTISGDGLFLQTGSAVGFVSGAYLTGGMLTNQAGGVISGFSGVLAAGGTTVDNFGTITDLAGGFAVFFGGPGDRLIEHQGAVLKGEIEDSIGDGTLQLATGIAGIGSITSFTGFSTLIVDAGASWDLAASNSFGGSLINNGTISETAADSLTASGNILGSGVIILDPTTVTLDGSVAAGQHLSFVGSGDVLVLGDAAGFNGQIDHFGAGDSIILSGLSTFTHESFVNGVLEITGAAETIALTFSSLPGNLEVLSAAGATTITEIACFAAGTRIATPDGEVAVEALKIGDSLCTLDAGPRQIKWIGQRSYDGRFIAGNRAALPICIRQNAIAQNIPCRDLWVSPGHAISIDGALIHAGRLVNGVSIIQASSVDQITYFHIEMESHQVIFAENCPAETFMDEHFRKQFQNAAEYKKAYPGERAARIACQQRLDHGFELHAIHTRIAARAGIAAPQISGALRGFIDQAGPGLCYGWAQDVAALTEPVCLDIHAGDRLIGRVLANLYRADVEAAGLGNGYQGFELCLPADITGPIRVGRSSDQALLANATPDPRAGQNLRRAS